MSRTMFLFTNSEFKKILKYFYSNLNTRGLLIRKHNGTRIVEFDHPDNPGVYVKISYTGLLSVKEYTFDDDWNKTFFRNEFYYGNEFFSILDSVGIALPAVV